MNSLSVYSLDSAALRKARGAYFTPEPVVRFMTEWAIRDVNDSVFEPSAGDAEFLVGAVRRLRELSKDPTFAPKVHGIEIHPSSAEIGRSRVLEAGGIPRLTTGDFFDEDDLGRFSAVVGNPPYVRYQDWSGDARTRSRAAALRSGVSLTGLASSWAAFTVRSAAMLQKGGRLALVLPAELLSVNYAAPVRTYLFEHFHDLEIVLFEEQLFADAEADVVLLLASGFGLGRADHATIRQSKNAHDLVRLGEGLHWSPSDPGGKWVGAGIVPKVVTDSLERLGGQGRFSELESWGDTTLGMVTGNNRFFALSPARARELGLDPRELLRLSPPGSSHLRGLDLTSAKLGALGRAGKQTLLFYPNEPPSPSASAYIDAGHAAGVDEAYKCRVRKTWYRVPLIRPADLLLTCMNADTPRLTTNRAGAYNLNSVHGVFLKSDVRKLGRESLPLASLNSLSLLSAEMVGRSYGGGILKLEPREADRWMVPTPTLVEDQSEPLRGVRHEVVHKLRDGKLIEAVALVDRALLLKTGLLSVAELESVRDAAAELTRRRTMRGKRG